MVDLRSSGRIFMQVNPSEVLTDLSHNLRAWENVLMHTDMLIRM